MMLSDIELFMSILSVSVLPALSTELAAAAAEAVTCAGDCDISTAVVALAATWMAAGG